MPPLAYSWCDPCASDQRDEARDEFLLVVPIVVGAEPAPDSVVDVFDIVDEDVLGWRIFRFVAGLLHVEYPK
jgi:hypothetical protein